MNKKILLIHTGGTISMSEDKGTGAVKPGKTNPLAEKSKELSYLAEIAVEEPFNLPSPHITEKEMIQLKNLIEKKMKEGSFSGIVITHGTDTLEETAYFLSLTIRAEIPIVFTGAMRSFSELGYDGLQNLINSIKVAASEDGKNKGVLIVFNDEIHSPEYATKFHTSNVSAFKSPQNGPIGIVGKGGVIFHHEPVKKKTYTVQNISKKVLLIKAYAGMDSTLLLAAAHSNCDGVVIEALGQGNLPPETLPGIEALQKKNIPVVLVSRCLAGHVLDTYGYTGGGKQLKEMGIIFANGLNGQKARLKLMVALSVTNDLKKVEEIIQN